MASNLQEICTNRCLGSLTEPLVGVLIKRVIDLLYRKRQPLNAEQINQECGVDLGANKAALGCLIKNNPKVHYNGGQFSYKPKHDIKNKDELLCLLRQFLDGISVADNLADAYPAVLEYLKSLETQDEIWLIRVSKRNKIAYPNNPRSSCHGIKVDDVFQRWFQGIELPEDMIDIEKYLRVNGMKLATDSAKRIATGIVAAAQPEEKKRRIHKRTKITNSHLPELFRDCYV